MTTGPLSIATCSWASLVAELGDPGLPGAAAGATVFTLPAGYRPARVTDPATVPLRLLTTGVTASRREPRP